MLGGQRNNRFNTIMDRDMPTAYIRANSVWNSGWRKDEEAVNNEDFFRESLVKEEKMEQIHKGSGFD